MKNGSFEGNLSQFLQNIFGNIKNLRNFQKFGEKYWTIKLYLSGELVDEAILWGIFQKFYRKSTAYGNFHANYELTF